jgi:hypothetical protein
MKAILIDAFNKTVKELKLNDKKDMLDQWYYALKADMVETAYYITDQDSILVDEEGLLKPCDHFFTYKGAHQPFAGNGLIVGVDEEGETVDCVITLEEVEQNVDFISRDEILKSLYNG